MREFHRDGNGNAVSDLVLLGNKVGTLIAVNTLITIGDGREDLRNSDPRVTAHVSLYALADDGSRGEKFEEKVLPVNGLASEVGSTDIASEEVRLWFVSKLVDIEQAKEE